MPTPTSQQVHIDRALTNVAIRYSNSMYIADRVFPEIPVRHISDKYFVYTKSDWFRDDAGVRAPGTKAQLHDYRVTTSNYTAIERAAGKMVPDEVVENADSPLRPFVDATNFTVEKLLIRREVEVLDNVFGAEWAASATPGTLWDNDAADPWGDIEIGVVAVTCAIGRQPTIGVVGRQVWQFLKNHPDVIDRVKGGAVPGNPAVAAQAMVAAVSGLERIEVSMAVTEDNEELESQDRSFIAGKHFIILYVTPFATIDTPNAGYIFTWKKRQTFRFRDDQAFSDIVLTKASWDTKLTATDAGYRIKSVVS